MTSLPIAAGVINHINGRILVASPNPFVRQRVFESLRCPVQRFEQATGGAEALGHLESSPWQTLFLDRRLPDLNAEELSEIVRQRFPGVEVVLLESDDDGGERPIGEVSASPAAADMADKTVGSALRDRHLEGSLPGMIGNARIMQPIHRLARLVAPRNTTALITGPTGCGKEVVARAIHQLSPRVTRAFVVVNCAAIPETMLEAELFGYARGAFTGAMQSYAGRIQAAQGGTLFLDEIGEMPLSLQPKLLRFLEQKELQRLGSSEVVRVDARVISATNAHLLSLVREGKFREDLYYRLSAFPIEIPALRDRPEDIASLAAHFLEKFGLRAPAPNLSSEALQVLKARTWAGNIRELQNVIERALILSEDRAVILPEDLSLPETRSGNAALPLGHLRS